MLKTLYVFYIAIMVAALAAFFIFFNNRADQFTRAIQIMEIAQSQSLAAWELTDKDFQLLTDAYDESFTHLFKTVGHFVSEDGHSVETDANLECDRCFLLADLKGATSSQRQYDALLAQSTLQPDAYIENVDTLLAQITENTRAQASMRSTMDEINTMTHDARLRIRYIKWFNEYRKTRDLGIPPVE